MPSEDYNLSLAMKPCSVYDSFDWLIFVVWLLVLIADYAVTDNHLLHWFVTPVYFCGVLISVDAVHWFRGKMDTFDPRGVGGAVWL